ncbi:4'-phosphopantetheinyl transferase superfamily protein [Micromonospora sp. NPDC023888]|uniref:4'-phosphopantetheinyl transferase family protein n=1 Tax=Micromonospora sp. NPDC023888 TaxID=3155607 RepID=UPI0033C0CAF8
MIERILPPGAATAEAFDDELPAPLFREEEQLVARAVATRRREFATGRRCAREALAKLGHPAVPLTAGERGAPRWPDGVVGSITHCAGYRAAVAAPATLLSAVGVDAEPHEALPTGILDAIAGTGERDLIAQLRANDPTVHWDRLLFCAKEAVYKAWFPLTRRWLGFEDAAVSLDPVGRRFEARLLVPGPLVGFSGRWMVDRGLLLTAVAVGNGVSLGGPPR